MPAAGALLLDLSHLCWSNGFTLPQPSCVTGHLATTTVRKGDHINNKGEKIGSLTNAVSNDQSITIN
jgi:hypothetical protein